MDKLRAWETSKGKKAAPLLEKASADRGLEQRIQHQAEEEEFLQSNKTWQKRSKLGSMNVCVTCTRMKQPQGYPALPEGHTHWTEKALPL